MTRVDITSEKIVDWSMRGIFALLAFAFYQLYGTIGRDVSDIKDTSILMRERLVRIETRMDEMKDRGEKRDRQIEKLEAIIKTK